MRMEMCGADWRDDASKFNINKRRLSECLKKEREIY